MEKLDLKKQFKHLYRPSAKKVVVVDVPPFNFVAIDGRMQPGETPDTSQAFHQALKALYGLSYTLKFMSKKREHNPIDYTVMALEGLWWVEEGGFDVERPEKWLWTLMMMQPDHITEAMYAEAHHRVSSKEPNPALDETRFEQFHEGLSMQIMHVGPYSEEARTIAKMMDFAAENGYALRGKHHEIYLGDPRRAKPENLKTVLRQPVEVAA